MRNEVFGVPTEQPPFYISPYGVALQPREGLNTTVERDELAVVELLHRPRIPDVLFPVYSPGVQTGAQSEALVTIIDAWKAYRDVVDVDSFSVFCSVDVGQDPFDSYAVGASRFVRREHEGFGSGVIYPLHGISERPIHDTFAEVEAFIEICSKTQNAIGQGIIAPNREYEGGLVIAMAPHVLGINMMVEALEAEDLVTVVSAEGVLRALDYSKYISLIKDLEYNDLTEAFYKGEPTKNTVREVGGLTVMKALSTAASTSPAVKRAIHRLLHR